MVAESELLATKFSLVGKSYVLATKILVAKSKHLATKFSLVGKGYVLATKILVAKSAQIKLIKFSATKEFSRQKNYFSFY